MDQPNNMKPWERPGYGPSGPLDPLHDTRINDRLSTGGADAALTAAMTDIGAASVVVEVGGIVQVHGLSDDDPALNPETVKAIREQRPDLLS